MISSLTANATALSELYLAHARPLVGQMTKQNFDRVYRHRPMLVAYYEIDWEENIKSEEDRGCVIIGHVKWVCHKCACHKEVCIG